MLLIPEKAAQMDSILRQLEDDNNFIDAASYPDEYVRSHDHSHQFGPWHYANLRDDGKPFTCGKCLFKALSDNLAIVREGKQDKSTAVAIAWVIHLVGDLHQPLHMSGRDGGGNSFNVTYRGQTECSRYPDGTASVELHSAWDDCLVEELANGRDPRQLAKDILGNIKTYKGRDEIKPPPHNPDQPWLAWGDDSHALANSVAFDALPEDADLGDSYIKGPGKALDVVQQQLLIAGIRLAYLLDENFK
jgi:hypothetical protein